MIILQVVEYNISTGHAQVVFVLPCFSRDVAREMAEANAVADSYQAQDTETDHTYYVRQR